MKRGMMLLVGVMALVLTACEKKQEPAARPEDGAAPLDQLDSGTTQDPVVISEPAPSGPSQATPPVYSAQNPAPSQALPPRSSTPPPAPVYEEELAPSRELGGPAGGQTHVVRKGDTLTGLARRYYGNANEWRRIWNANRSRVPNKDRLKIGTKLIIP